MKNNITNFLLAAALGIGVGVLVLKDDESQPLVLPNPNEDRDKQEKEEEIRNQFPLRPSPVVNEFIRTLQQNIIDHGPILAKNFVVNTGGADGVFGQGLRNALTAMALPRNEISFDDYVLINKQLNDGFSFGDYFSNLF